MVTLELQNHQECQEVEICGISPDLTELYLGVEHSDPHGPSAEQMDRCVEIAWAALKGILEHYELVD
jgi:hypothetical protein